jgi:hypothetical protein
MLPQCMAALVFHRMSPDRARRPDPVSWANLQLPAELERDIDPPLPVGRVRQTIRIDRGTRSDADEIIQ